jgi:hypothetical protein
LRGAKFHTKKTRIVSLRRDVLVSEPERGEKCPSYIAKIVWC